VQESPETDEPVAAPAAAVGATPAPPAEDPYRRVAAAPDRGASFAEVAQAVDVATDRPAETAPASPFSEDLIPQRLPKRGRRASKLETPWVRERPVVSAPAVSTAPPVAGAVPPGADGAPTASGPAPLPARSPGE